jgi:SCY1-like protein 1
VFTFRGDAQRDHQRVAIARNGVKRLKTIRHPNVLLMKDTIEIENGSEITIHIVTEPVTPLETHLRDVPIGTVQRDEYFTLGLREVATAVAFLSNDCKLVHGGVSLSAVVVTERLDWKLHGFDLCSELESVGRGLNGDAKLIHGAYLVPDQYKPEEYRRGDWVSIPEGPPWAIDAWGLGCLIQEVYSGGALRGTDQLREIDCIPKTLLKDYQRLLGSQPTRRYNPKKLIENSSLFANKLVETITFINNLALKDSIEKERFFGSLPRVLDTLAPAPVQKKILPMLCDALAFNQAPHHAILPMLLAAEEIPREKYQELVIPTVFKLFEVQDKMVRLDLLENLSRYADRVPDSKLDDPLYERMSTGFASPDSNVREMTLRGVQLLVPRLSERVITASLLRHLSKLQIDEDPAIRANTTICLGNIAQYLSAATAKRVLLNAFTRSLKDAFPPARLAGLMALEHTPQYYDPAEVSQRLIPALSPLLTDNEKDVRVKAFSIMSLYVDNLKDHSQALERGPEAAAAHVEEQQKKGHANAAKRAANMLSWAVNMAANKIGGPDEDHAPIDLQSEKLMAKSFSSAAPPPKLYGESPRTSTQNTPATSLGPSPAKPMTDAYDANRRNLEAAAQKVSALSLGRQDDFGDDDDADGWGDLDVVDPAEEAARARLNARTSTASFGAGSNRLSTSSAMTKSSSVGSHASDGWGDDEDLFEDMSAPAVRPPVAARPVAPQARPGASMGARQASGGHVSIGGVRRPAAPLAGSRSMGAKPPPMKLGGAKSALTSSKDIDLEAMLNE